MHAERETALIALDWGTSSLRAWRLAPGGAVLEARRADLGILRVVGGAFAAALSQVAEDWRAPGVPVLMCGMIGSRQGWVEAPYVACPAGLSALAAALAEVPDEENVRIVPGASLRPERGAPEVMRGEETQLLGIDIGEPGVCVLPGTHSKWVVMEAGEIAWFTTFMTGEVYEVLQRHSILGRLMTEPRGEDPAAFRQGVAEALAPAGAGTLQSLFGVRTRGLFGDLAADQLASYLSGLLIGAEIREARAALAARNSRAERLTVIGAGPLTALYEEALAMAGIATRRAGEDSAARGLWRIAGAAQLVEARP